MPVSKKEASECPLDAALSVVDGRWKGTILWRLSTGPLRTSELRRSRRFAGRGRVTGYSECAGLKLAISLNIKLSPAVKTR